MTVKKSALKQRLKYLLQKTWLPFCYNLNRKKPCENSLVLFADSNSDTPPESMTLLIKELESRGYNCEMWCKDITKLGILGTIGFMGDFMKRYAVSGTVVICNFFVPINACEKRSETTVVQLWHSCGALKKFGYSTESDIPKSYKGNVGKNIDLVTVSSPECVSVFEEAFALGKAVARPIGVSRTDIFFDEEYKCSCRKRLYEACPELKGKKIILYLPTFRGDASNAYCVGHEQMISLKDSFENAHIIVRMHPRVKDGICELKELSTNELMLCADVLVTDYSSAVFEFALLKKPIVLWCPDLEEYLDERDFYLDFDRDMPVKPVTKADELESAVGSALLQKDFDFGEFLNKYMSACDGKSTKRIADIIDNK